MSTRKTTKINQLLTSQPYGVVFQSAWLTEQGYNADLQKRYRASGWLQSIGTGAMIRAGDIVNYEGAIYALQKQTLMSVHPAGRTALSLLGKTHYLELASKSVTVFGDTNEKLPLWFQKHSWDKAIDFHKTSFLPSNIGLVDVEFSNFSIKVSNAARAVMECLYLAPEKQELVECYELIQGLNNLRPNQVQELLEKCKSIKVKRLFMYMAEKINHDWFQYIDKNKVDLGSGKRSIVKRGKHNIVKKSVYIPKYQITVPKELEEYDKRNV